MKLDLSASEIETIAFCTVRYALGRRTYVVSDVASLVRKLRPSLHEWRAGVLRREILEAIEAGRAGDKCDEDEWRALAEVLK